MRTLGTWRAIFVAVAVGTAFGCGRESVLGNREPEGGGTTHVGVAMAVAPTYSTNLSPTTSRTGIGPIPLGTYAEQTLVEIKATGFIDRYWGYVWYYGPKQGQFDQQIDAAGINGTQNAHIGFDSPAAGWFLDSQGLPLQDEWRKVVIVQGTGRATWVRPGTGGQCDSPGTPDCFSYTGSFEISVTPFPAVLELRASRPAVTPGQNVTFTASVTPDSIEGIAVPFKVAEWRWQPDAGGAGTLLPQCANQKTCNYAPSVSGTMRAIGFANGAADEATAHVTVFPCLTGDSLLDDPLLRSALRTSWLLSDANNPDATARMERSGVINCDTATGACGAVLFEPGPEDNWCQNDITDPHKVASLGPGTIVIWHTHPFTPSDTTDIIPASALCPGISGSLPAKPGPSRGDYLGNAGRIHVVVDGDGVWVIPGLPVPKPGDTYDRPRNGSGACDALASPIT